MMFSDLDKVVFDSRIPFKNTFLMNTVLKNTNTSPQNTENTMEKVIRALQRQKVAEKILTLI